MRFPIRFSGPGRAMVVLGLTRRASAVDLTDDAINVRMAWAFRASAPRTVVASAARSRRFVLDRGVHGWFGRWLVNGSGKGLVRLDFDPPMPGHLGPLPIRVRVLWVSLEDPDGFLAALAAAPG